MWQLEIAERLGLMSGRASHQAFHARYDELKAGDCDDSAGLEQPERMAS
jgi:hypothetical protein